MADVSIIVPVYDVEPYLHRCIDSIRSQIFFNYELILVDDGSPDHCGEICDTYAEKDGRIHVIHQKNAGLSAARNTGINWALNQSDSEWITFIDSDDWVHPLYLESLYNAAKDNNVNVAICKYVRTEGTSLPNLKKVTFCQMSPEDYYNEDRVNATVAWGKLYRKNLFDEIRFPIGKIHEDEYTTYKVLFQCERVAGINEPLYAYYQNPEGIMSRPWSLKRLDILDALEAQVAFFDKHHQLNLANRQFFSWINKNIAAQEKIQNLPELSDKEKQVYIRRLQKKLREMLRKYRHYRWVSGLKRNDRWYYMNAYPMMMRMVRIWRPVKYSLKASSLIRFSVNCFSNLTFGAEKLKALWKFAGETHKTDVVLLQSPLHGNLGDHAIAEAETCLLNANHITYIDYPYKDIDVDSLSHAVLKNKTILITGGGWLGNLWPNEEERFRATLAAFRRNRIIVFPQTVYFDLQTEEGNRYFEESKMAYGSHPDLIIFVRERYSYDFMKEYMPKVHVKLVPDMVMTLKPDIQKMKRKGALICLRGDKERILSDEDERRLLETLRTRYTILTRTDTVLKEKVDLEHRKSAVQEKLSEFAAAELIVTDRLHGVIFAAITETPCIVLDSLSHKLRGCYEWLKDLEYIRLVKNMDDVSAYMRDLENVIPEYDWSAIETAMKPLYDELKNIR